MISLHIYEFISRKQYKVTHFIVWVSYQSSDEFIVHTNVFNYIEWPTSVFFRIKSESKFNFIKIVMNLIDFGRSRLNKVEPKIDFHNVWLDLHAPYGWYLDMVEDM